MIWRVFCVQRERLGFQDSWILDQDKLRYVQLWHLNKSEIKFHELNFKFEDKNAFNAMDVCKSITLV